jgi:hypothetical protein
MTFYRNRETGIIQAHPVSGLGETFNSDEVGEDAKPIVPLGASTDETKRRLDLAKAPKTPEATTGTGSTEKKGAK